MSNEIIISLNKSITNETKNELSESFKELDIDIKFIEEEAGDVWNSLELLIPAAITFIVANYFAGFMNELGAASAKKFIDTTKKFYKKLNKKNRRILSNNESNLLMEELRKLKTEKEKQWLMQTHKYGQDANVIGIECRSRNHNFIARYILPGGLNDIALESAFKSMKEYSNQAEDFLLLKEKVYNEFNHLEKDSPDIFYLELKKRGFTTYKTTVFLYSTKDGIWKNTEDYIFRKNHY